MSNFFDRLWGKTQEPAAPAPEPDPELAVIPDTAVPEISARELQTRLDSPEPPFVVDVREPYEWSDGGVPGAVQMPVNSIPGRLAELPHDRVIVTYCSMGERSWYVAEFLIRNGFAGVCNLSGGLGAWESLRRFVR